MKRLLVIAGFLFMGVAVEGALISRTYTYTAGNTITANENNTNETTLYNEVNGNLNSANLLDGGVSTADLADSGVTTAKLAASLTINTLSVGNSLTVSSNVVLAGTTYYQNGTIVTNSTITFNGGGIKGRINGAFPSDTFVGQVSSTTIATGVSSGATGVFGDLASVSLTTGHWAISMQCLANTQQAAAVTELDCGISSTSGNSSSGMTEPASLLEVTGAVGASDVIPMAISNVPVSVTGTTVYYLKYKSIYSGSIPQYKGHIVAERRD